MDGTNIWDEYGRWDQYAQLANLEDVKTKIAANRAWRPNFVPRALEYVFGYAVDEMLASSSRTTPTVVDFGCGLGRNGPMLRRYFQRVVGIDLPEMVERVAGSSALSTERVYAAIYGSPSDLVAQEEFCTLYDSVVMQHIVDHGYLAELLDLLSTRTRFRTLASVYFAAGNTSAHLEVLKHKGWQIWHSEPDCLSFEGAPHTLTVFRRW